MRSRLLDDNLRGETVSPKISIVLLAYNHLDYTKQCIESLFKYTNEDYELILLNNGSNDGTKEYFNELTKEQKNVRAVHLTKNVGPINAWNIGIKRSRGKYVALVCNDLILTTNWLSNLVTCLESSEQIGFVSPGANFISNFQQIKGQYRDMDEMQEFAKQHNISDARKWEERLRVMPCVLLARKQIFYDICFFDNRFYYGEYGDDDFSFRTRRAGFKAVYAADTFIYHYGSVTTDIEHKELNTYEISRKLFIEKYGSDLVSAANYNPSIVNGIKPHKDKLKILGVNTYCGATPLQLKNEFKKVDVYDVSIDSITDDNKYLIDLRTVSDNVSKRNLAELDLQDKYDIIILESGLERYKDTEIETIIAKLINSLAPSGGLYIQFKNIASSTNIMTLLSGAIEKQPNNKFITAYLDPMAIRTAMLDKGLTDVDVTLSASENPKAVDALAAISPGKNKDTLKVILSSKAFLVSGRRA